MATVRASRSQQPRRTRRATDPAGQADDFQDLAEHLMAPLHWVAGDGTILWANRAELEMLGYTREEYVGRHIAEFHVDRPVIDDILARLARQEVLRDYEARLRHRDGSIRHVSISSSVRWRDGEFSHTRCLTLDVTEQKRLDDQRRRAARNVAAQYAVTRVLAEAHTLEQVTARVLEAVGDVGSWSFGALWRVDEDARVLRCVDVWRTHGAASWDFETATRTMTFDPGIGLPGRVWATRTPAWIEDVAVDANFPRILHALRADLHGAFGFPLKVRDRVTGVLEFFSRDVREPDADTLQLFDAIGALLGQFMERLEIAQTRAHLAAIVDSSDDAIVGKTLDGRITSWNQGAERIFGYTAEEAIGRHVSLVVPEDRHAEEEDVLARLARGEKVDHFETERRRKDGQRIAISLALSPVRGADGALIGSAAVAREITAWKRTEAALVESERRTRLLNRIGEQVAARLDRDDVVQTVTDLATELTGAEFGAFFYHVQDPQSGEVLLLYTLSGAPKEAFAAFPKPRPTALFGPTFRGEGVIRLDDVTRDARYGHNAPHHGMPAGHLPVRSYLAVPVKARSGEVLGALFFGHSDVGVFTAEHEELMQGVASWASVGLENARLYARAEEAVQARDDFISIASHELRNPLNALQLQLVGLHRSVSGSDLPLDRARVQDRLGQANADVARLVRLVDHLLDVSRISAGRVDLEPEELELGSVVSAILERLASQIGTREVLVDAVPVVGRWDRLRLDQIVTNLVTNAIKYGMNRPVEIGLRGDGGKAYLSVRDQGIGIDPAQQARLFQRFERVVSRRQFGGLGLGLWITRQVVEAMGGRISVVSDVGRGSTFFVELPLASPAAPSSGRGAEA